MRIKEVKETNSCCPYCGSDRVSPSNDVEIEEIFNELKLSFYCIDCGETYDAIFVFTGRLVVGE